MEQSTDCGVAEQLKLAPTNKLIELGEHFEAMSRASDVLALFGKVFSFLPAFKEARDRQAMSDLSAGMVDITLQDRNNGELFPIDK